MRKRSSRAGAAAAAAASVLLGLVCPAAASSFTELTYSLTSAPLTCGWLAHDFGTRYFDYNAGYSSNTEVPADCLLQISPLYMEGTCSSQRNNGESGCSGGASGSTVSASNASCTAVVEDAPQSWWTPLEANYMNYRVITLFDTGSLCAATEVGYFYISNTCNQSFDFQITLQTYAYSSCSGSSGFPAWARITIGVVCGLVAMALFVAMFRRCGRTARPSPQVVQLAGPSQGMAPAGSTGPYGAFTPTAAYPAPAGYPPAAGQQQQPAYAGAWGAGASPPSGGYGPGAGGMYGGNGYGGGAGYGQPGGRPPHVPPPMTTVVLGAPDGEEGGTSTAPKV